MAKQIKRSDLAEEDIYKGIRESAEKTIQVITKINDEFKMTAVVLKDSISGAKFDSSKGINDFNKAVEKSSKLAQQTIKNEQELQKARELRAKADERLEKLAQSKLRTDEQAVKTAETLAKSEQRKAKETEKAAKAAENEANAYKQLEKNTRELKNESKRLAAEMLKLESAGEKNTKEFRQLAREYKSVTAAAQQGDQALKKIDGTVGDNFRNVGNYTGAISKLKSGLSQLGVAFGIGASVNKIATVLKDFDEGAADIAKTTGLTTEKTKELSQELLKFDTKTSVTELQGLAAAAGSLNVEGEQNIIGFVESADKAFVALGDDLGGTSQEIATSIGKIAGVFGDEAKFGIGEAINKVGSSINELAGKSKAAAAPILDFTQRMAGLGNLISSADANALGAFFDEGGQSVEVASSTLNTLLPKMAQNYKDFAKTAGMSAEEFKKLAEESPVEALKAVAKGAKNSEKGLFNLSKTVESFGVDSARATSIVGFLANNTDRLTELQKISNDAFKEGTSLTNEFNTKNNTLSASYDKLINAVDEWIISMDSATGVSGFIADAMVFLAENIGTILTVVTKAALAWGVYKTMILGIKAKNAILNFSLKDTIKSMKEIFANTKKMGEGAKEAGKNIGDAGKSMKAVPWIAIIGMVIELAMALYDVATGADKAAASVDAYNKLKITATNENKKFVQGISDEIEANSKLLELAVARGEMKQSEANKERKAFLQSKQFFKEVSDFETRQSKTVYFNIFGKIQDQVEEVNRNIKLTEANIRSLKAEGEFKNRLKIGKEEGRIKALKESRGVLWEYNRELKNELHNLTVLEEQEKNNNSTGNENSKLTDKKKESVKALNTELSKQNEYLSKQTELLNDISLINQDTKVRDVQTEIDTLFANELKKARETGQLDVDQLEELIDLKYQIKSNSIDMEQAYEIESIKEKYRIEGELALKALQDERDRLLAQEGLTTEAKAKIIKNYDDAKIKIDEDNLQRNADMELEILKIKMESSNKQLDLENEKKEEINTINNELIQGQIEYSDKQAEISKAANAKAAEDLKNHYDRMNEVVKMAADYFIKKSEEKIAQLEKEISAAEKTYDAYQQMAINGNIDAKESLAEQQKIINEANQRKAEEQKRIERIKLAESVYSGYTANVEKGEKNPLAKTITDITLLRQFVASLPGFYEGTDTTVTNALGAPLLPGRDGHVIRVDGDEKILNPGLSKMTGNMTTSEIARVSQDYLTGKLIRSGDTAVQIGSPWINYAMIEKMDEMTNAIKNMPENSYELGQVTQESFMLLQRKSKGKDIIYNRYKVK